MPNITKATTKATTKSTRQIVKSNNQANLNY